ncbi:hypothetical protein IQ243_24680 [Nostocales cyanobacterium LEGE 11386]|nr:hypothetical protein [Nostocales cyanobacterium LEGE 11386]
MCNFISLQHCVVSTRKCPKSQIIGFYKTPKQAISQQQVEGIVGAIAHGEVSTDYFMR